MLRESTFVVKDSVKVLNKDWKWLTPDRRDCVEAECRHFKNDLDVLIDPLVYDDGVRQLLAGPVSARILRIDYDAKLKKIRRDKSGYTHMMIRENVMRVEFDTIDDLSIQDYLKLKEKTKEILNYRSFILISEITKE